MNTIYMEKFTNHEEVEMMAFMNNDGSPISVISICQSKSNIYTVFYWGK